MNYSHVVNRLPVSLTSYANFVVNDVVFGYCRQRNAGFIDDAEMNICAKSLMI